MENINETEEAQPQKKWQLGKIIWLVLCILSSLRLVFLNLDTLDKVLGLVIIWIVYFLVILTQIILTQKYYKKKTFWLALWAFIGLGLSIKLTIIYYMMNFVPDAPPSFCAINETIDCDAVARTTYAQMFGIPTACFGLFLYSFVFGMCFVDKLKNIKLLSFLEVFKDKFSYIFTIYCISFAVSMYLMMVQFVDIHKFCLLCFITYLVDFVSIFIAKDYSKPWNYEIKTSIIDFIEAVKVKKYFIALIVVCLCAAGFVYYTKTSYIFTPQMKNYDEFMHFKNMKGNPFKIHGNVLGNPEGEVIVYEYSDFECPMCPVMNKMLQQAAAKDFENVFVLHYNFPLDNKCNPLVTRPFHQNACLFARFALAAKKQDKYWEMINLLFSNKPRSNQELFKMAMKKGIDPNQLANDFLHGTEEELNEEIMSARNRQVEAATPTIFIGNKKYVGLMSYDELKNLLIENGAKLKNKK